MGRTPKTARVGQATAASKLRAVQALKDENRAVELRSLGLSWRAIAVQIAKEGGNLTTEGGCRNAVTRALTRCTPMADALRADMLAKLERREQELSLMFYDAKKDTDQRLRVEDRLTRIDQTKARITGLNTVHVTVEEVTVDDITAKLDAFLQGADTARHMGNADPGHPGTVPSDAHTR